MKNAKSFALTILILVMVLLVFFVFSSVLPTKDQKHKELQPNVLAEQNSNTAFQSSPSTHTKGAKTSGLEERKNVIARIEAALKTPIHFYDKVVDQNDEPVPYANIGYSLLDKFDASGSTGDRTADDHGYFEIAEAKGVVLGVNVSREGYYQIPDISNQRFAYGTGVDAYTKEPPSKDRPAVFRLHKKERRMH